MRKKIRKPEIQQAIGHDLKVGDRVLVRRANHMLFHENGMSEKQTWLKNDIPEISFSDGVIVTVKVVSYESVMIEGSPFYHHHKHFKKLRKNWKGGKR